MLLIGMEDSWLFAKPMWNKLARTGIRNEKVSRLTLLNFFSIRLAYEADQRSIGKGKSFCLIESTTSRSWLTGVALLPLMAEKLSSSY